MVETVETFEGLSFAVRYHQLPLAVYREIAAHVQCVPGVAVTLHENRDPEFNYLDSQIAYMTVQLAHGETRSRVEQILDHYGLWQQSRDPEPADPCHP